MLVFSATESDPWARELITLAASELGFEPWKAPSTAGHLDVYGPYETQWQGKQLEVTIVFAGLTTVAELLPQQVLGEEAREWLAGQDVDILWLDGDPAQLQIGAQLPASQPILFTGVVNSRELYYPAGAQVTGVYQRHSLAGVLSKVWMLDPERFQDETRPRQYALITDDSPISISRATRFATLELALPAGHTWLATPAAKSWDDLHEVIDDMQDKADALIFCGVGEERCNDDFVVNAPPMDLLDGNVLPAVVLGPSRMDQSGATVLSITPSAAVDEALERLGKMLDGRDAAGLGVVEPSEMAVYQASRAGEGEDESVSESEVDTVTG